MFNKGRSKELITRSTLVSFCISTLVLFSVQPSVAEDTEETSQFGTMLAMNLEELVELEVELATGTSKPINLAPAVASVITAGEIERIGAKTLNEALQIVPGLHVAPSPKNAMSQIFSFRGVHTSVNPQVLLLMNGVPIGEAHSGSRSNFHYPVASISKIEVVRGPGSALHGADAFAGVINIITKDGQELGGTTVGARAGSFESYEGWLQHGNMYNGWNVGISLEYQESQGDKDRKLGSDLQTALDESFGTTASRAADEPLGTKSEMINAQCSVAKDGWILRLWGQSQDNLIADGVTQTVADNSGEISQFLGQLTYEKNVNDDLQANLDLSYNYMHQARRLQLFPEGSVLPLGSDGNIDFATPVAMALFQDGVFGLPVEIDHQYNFEVNSLYKGFHNQLWRLAFGFRSIKEKFEEAKNFGPGVSDNLNGMPEINVIDGTLTDVTGTPFIYMENKGRELYYVSLQNEWALSPKLELTAGIRYDHYSDFGDTINPRVALVWENRYDLTSKLMYGRAFRPPSFTELYSKNNPSTTGNPNLDPETIDTYELAFDYQPLSSLRLMANTFFYEIEDLVELVQEDPNVSLQVAQNNKNQQGYGVELEVDWVPIDTLHLKANLAHQRSKDDDTKEIVPDAPALQAYVNAHWKFLPDWSVNVQYFWISKRSRAHGDTREEIKDNDIVNVSLHRKKLFPHLDLTLSVRNLFNEDIREPSLPAIPTDYPMESRAIWGELRYTF